jgi:hypothetical protein
MGPLSTPTSGRVNLPPPPREGRWDRLKRRWRSRGRHGGIRHWFLTAGLPLSLSLAILFALNGAVIGWTTSYEVMIGITSPSKTTLPVLAWFLSVAGWLVAPGVAGAVAGYIVSSSIDSRRSRPIGELFSQEDKLD